MSHVANLFAANKPNLYEDFLNIKGQEQYEALQFAANTRRMAARHHCGQSCPRNCRLLANSCANIYPTIQSTLPNNRKCITPILIESKLNPALGPSSEPHTSNFSDFRNYKAFLDSLERERSKYFDIYYPNEQKATLKSNNSVCDSLSSSQSSLTDEIKSDSERSTNSPVFNLTALQTNYQPLQQQPKQNPIKEEIKNFNLHYNPVQFDMAKVSYVKTLAQAKTIIEKTIGVARVIALNLDSDCCLQNGVDLLEVAVMNGMTLDHPEIYVFDTHLEPHIIELFKPVFANGGIVKVMFDSRFDLRILCRKYGVSEFVAMFDIQLAYRFLLAKKTDSRLEDIKREKLLYVSWQCNGPMANIEKLYLPAACYFKNRPFWKTRPVNFEIMYKAAYDVFVMVPQLFTNLVVMMERTLSEADQQQFIKRSNELIIHNLVPRKFAFFRTKHQYLGEMHKQIDLLIQSDILYRNRQKTSKWKLNDEDYAPSSEHYDGLDSTGDKPLKRRIDDTDTVSYKSYKSYNSTEGLMNSADDDLIYFTDDHESDCSETDSASTNYHELSDDQFDNLETFGDHSAESVARSGESPITSGTCDKCQLPIKDRNGLNELIDNLETDSLKKLLFGGLQQFCKCVASVQLSQEEVKCMNLLVDQIIDLAECKEDYMELDE